jgi:hypothetical protein
MEQHLIGIIALLTGVMLFSYWIHYCMGSPMAKDVKDVDVGAILFFLPRDFSDRRLAKLGILIEMWERHNDELKLTDDPVRHQEMRIDFERDRYEAGRKFFTWERSVLCPICLHWWLTVLVVNLCIAFGWLHMGGHLGAVALTYLVNHFFIRKIS